MVLEASRLNECSENDHTQTSVVVAVVVVAAACPCVRCRVSCVCPQVPGVCVLGARYKGWTLFYACVVRAWCVKAFMAASGASARPCARV
jgi:hypothetical protein